MSVSMPAERSRYFAVEFTRRLFNRMLTHQNAWLIAHYFSQVPAHLRDVTSAELLTRLGATGELWRQ